MLATSDALAIGAPSLAERWPQRSRRPVRPDSTRETIRSDAPFITTGCQRLNDTASSDILKCMGIKKPGVTAVLLLSIGMIVGFGYVSQSMRDTAPQLTPTLRVPSPQPTFRLSRAPRPTFPHTAPTIAYQGRWRTHVDPYLRFVVPVPSTWTIRSGGLRGALSNAEWVASFSPPTPENTPWLGYSIDVKVAPVTVAQRSSWEFAEAMIEADNDVARTEPTLFHTQFIGQRELRRATTDLGMVAIFFFNDLMYQLRLNDGRDAGAGEIPDVSPGEWDHIVSIYEHVLRSFSPDPSVTSAVFFNEPLQPWEK